MTSICIFCGSREGLKPEYKQAAMALVEELVRRNITLVYGAGNIGIMGVIANHALALGGKVIGVIPDKLLELELVHEGLSELHRVEDMHERKQKMAQLADGFITLPGGSGTLDELFQEIVMRQVGYHNKACALLNTGGYYDHLISFLNHATSEGFLDPEWRKFVIVEQSPSRLVTKLLETSK